ncbi:cupin domain-containing protein [Roseibium salinum]|uniref:cupin domain-containing protein n=1 Tax=Roseibium salinum TaxID=1604349 RepID=UPI00360DF01D
MSELLMGMRLLGVHYQRVLATPPFGLRFATVPGRAQFHFVSRGPVYLRNALGGAGDAEWRRGAVASRRHSCACL